MWIGDVGAAASSAPNATWVDRHLGADRATAVLSPAGPGGLVRRIGARGGIAAASDRIMLEVKAGCRFQQASRGPCDHRLGDHDVLDGDAGEIGHRDIVG